MPSRALGSCVGALLIAGLLACGDDDPKGPGDASTDGAVVDSGGGIFIPRRDSSVVPTDPIRSCNRWIPDSCPPGQTCDVLFRVDPDQNVVLQQGCVTTTRERGLGDPCDPDFSASEPYETEGLTETVWRDPCGPGLICAPDPKIRGGSSCQPSCVTGAFRMDDPTPILCEDPKSFCVASSSRGPFREFCVPSDGCDVVSQTGCAPGLACYLRTNDEGTGFLSVCYPPAPPEMTVPDGQSCEAYNACRPGSSCNGPLKKPIDMWVPEDIICRSACSEDGSLPGGGEDDAGTEDGGIGSGEKCGSPRMCVSFESSGLSTSGITKPPYGQCE